MQYFIRNKLAVVQNGNYHLSTINGNLINVLNYLGHISQLTNEAHPL